MTYKALSTQCGRCGILNVYGVNMNLFTVGHKTGHGLLLELCLVEERTASKIDVVGLVDKNGRVGWASLVIPPLMCFVILRACSCSQIAFLLYGLCGGFQSGCGGASLLLPSHPTRTSRRALASTRHVCSTAYRRNG